MSDHTIKVIATINAISGKEDKLKKVLINLIEPTRKEPGCLNYLLLNNIGDTSEFTFFEEWDTAEDLERHMQTPHFNEVINRLEGLISAEPVIKQYHLIEKE